ncbi:MAG: nicotinate-nucleotide adenylyltransferase [Flavobacteriales bacterium]|nr:nicotinate-nucleotide adenylyltransferase [Flavobacteriales bacterium]
MKKRTGLYFGTFNPIHIGHLVIANFMANHTDLDEVWLIVTPHNPLKDRGDLLPDDHRLQMVRLATIDNNKLEVSDVEFNLPQPNYTINTLDLLQERYSDTEFVLIMGEDNLRSLHRWKDYERMVSSYDIFVYPRSITEGENTEESGVLVNLKRVTICEAPMIRISSTFLRNAIRTQKDIRYLVPDKVINYISNNYLYEK